MIGVSNVDANWTCSTCPKAKAKPMKEPNVPMYNNDTIHACGSRHASRIARFSFVACVRLSMNNEAHNAAMMMSGM